jgi:phage terminase large subunit-like protein
VPACRLHILACKRHLADLVDGPARGLTWEPAWAVFAIGLFPHFKHSKGEWGGHPVVLEPWQEFVVGSVWGWRLADGTRRFRSVWEELPRKNGKSTKLAGIGLLCLLADDEPGAEIYSAATKKDQAALIFTEAKRMLRSNPDLRALVQLFKWNISVDETGSKFEPVSSDADTLDGLNPSCALVDEVHKHKSRALLDVLITGMGARRQPLLWEITTAGDDTPESVYAQEHDYAVAVLEGRVINDAQFVFITSVDDPKRWNDPKEWAKANPNLGVSVKLKTLQDAARKAQGSPPALREFLRLHLNVRTTGADRAIEMPTWARNSLGADGPARNEEGHFDEELLRGEQCFGGLDLASKLDLTAWVKLFPPKVGRPRWTVSARFWMPEDRLASLPDRDQAFYREWIANGFIEVTPGAVTDHNEVRRVVAEDARRFNLTALAYDSWNALQIAVQLQQDGIDAHEFVQGVRSYNGPMKEFLAMLAAEQLDHGDNPVLTWMAGNLAITKPDKNLNYMPSKMHSTGKIDGMTALIMALGLSMTVEDDGLAGFLSSSTIAPNG